MVATLMILLIFTAGVSALTPTLPTREDDIPTFYTEIDNFVRSPFLFARMRGGPCST